MRRNQSNFLTFWFFKYFFMFRLRYRARMKNGELVEDQAGPLIVTHKYLPAEDDHVINHNDDEFSQHDPNLPLDLTKPRKIETKTIVVNPIIMASSASSSVLMNDSGYTASPQSADVGLDLSNLNKKESKSRQIASLERYEKDCQLQAAAMESNTAVVVNNSLTEFLFDTKIF